MGLCFQRHLFVFEEGSTRATTSNETNNLELAIDCITLVNVNINMVALRIRPAIVLFGDSITQQGFGLDGKIGWASLLASDYSRRADVFNRGFSGYNTKMAMDLLPSIFSSSSDDMDSGTLFCTVFFGANDAALPGERQHVPMEEYAKNLGTIVTSIR